MVRFILATFVVNTFRTIFTKDCYIKWYFTIDSEVYSSEAKGSFLCNHLSTTSKFRKVKTTKYSGKAQHFKAFKSIKMMQKPYQKLQKGLFYQYVVVLPN